MTGKLANWRSGCSENGIVQIFTANPGACWDSQIRAEYYKYSILPRPDPKFEKMHKIRENEYFGQIDKFDKLLTNPNPRNKVLLGGLPNHGKPGDYRSPLGSIISAFHLIIAASLEYLWPRVWKSSAHLISTCAQDFQPRPIDRAQLSLLFIIFLFSFKIDRKEVLLCEHNFFTH